MGRKKYCGKCWTEDLDVFFKCASRITSEDLVAQQCPTCREEDFKHENSQNKATKQKSKGYKMIKKGLNKLKDIKP